MIATAPGNVSTPARKPNTALTRRVRDYERSLAALTAAVARHGLAVCDEAWEDDNRGRGRSLPRQHIDVRAASEAVRDRSCEVVELLLELHPDVETPTWRDWYHSSAPIIRHRLGRRLLLVVPGWPAGDAMLGEGEPRDDWEIATSARLVIVDLD